ncbi:MAG: cyclodeaminase/cyclohydrolase family protein [Candidatus Omnitrophota bacterium]|nr:cyclodeaminase/cyclohydrolase family protein [Candidatus Omnitrophota bacterium]
MGEKPFLQATVEQYLRELSQRSIVPGGGSVSALAAALGAGLNLMVINYSADHNSPEKATRAFSAARKRQEESLEHLSRLIDEDCKVFRELMDALAEKRDAQKEYKAAASVPMRICRECHISMHISEHLLENANRNLLTDIGCAVRILKAAYYSAELNAAINLGHIRDTSFAESTVKILRGMRKDIEVSVRDIQRQLAGLVEQVEGKDGEEDQW